MTTEPDRGRTAVPPAVTDGTAQPVSVARRGFTPAQVAGFHAGWAWRDVLKTGDASLYMFLHPAEFYPSAAIPRSGSVVPLGRAPDPRAGAVRLPAPGGPSLDEYLEGEGSRAQGMIVVRRGEVVFERYPGMREDDSHITMSVAKTMPALVVGQLEAEGKVDVRRAVGPYVPALAGTAWHDVPVADVLDMASGLDVEETDKNRDDPRSTFGRFLRAVLNVPGADGPAGSAGGAERHTDVIRSAARLRDPGRVYEYSSLNTQVLVLLAEAVEGRPWAEVFRERVWSKLSGEGDAAVLVSPDGVALPFGFVSMRLRDLARYGMLYTPGWGRAAREPVVPPGLVRRIRAGAWANRGTAPPPGAAAGDTGRHWDGVGHTGGMYKTGLHGQGLYVSPEKDLVIAWFSAAPSSELLAHALAVARLYG